MIFTGLTSKGITVVKTDSLRIQQITGSHHRNKG